MHPRTIIIVLLLAAYALGSSGAEEVEPDRSSAFPSLLDVFLSPNGQYLAGRTFVDGRLAVVVWDVAERRIQASAFAGKVNWLRWADDKRLLVSSRIFEAIIGGHDAA